MKITICKTTDLEVEAPKYFKATSLLGSAVYCKQDKGQLLKVDPLRSISTEPLASCNISCKAITAISSAQFAYHFDEVMTRILSFGEGMNTSAEGYIPKEWGEYQKGSKP